jgi:hypothetical protein
VTGTASEAQQIRTELDQAFRNTTVANLTSEDARLSTQLSSTSPTQSGASGSTVANPDYQKLLDEKSLNDAKMLNLGLTPSTVSLPNPVNTPVPPPPTEPPANITFVGSFRGDSIYVKIFNNGKEIGEKSYSSNYVASVNGKDVSGIEGAIETLKFELDVFGLYLNGLTYKQGEVPK